MLLAVLWELEAADQEGGRISLITAGFGWHGLVGPLPTQGVEQTARYRGSGSKTLVGALSLMCFSVSVTQFVHGCANMLTVCMGVALHHDQRFMARDALDGG